MANQSMTKRQKYTREKIVLIKWCWENQRACAKKKKKKKKETDHYLTPIPKLNAKWI